MSQEEEKALEQKEKEARERGKHTPETGARQKGKGASSGLKQNLLVSGVVSIVIILALGLIGGGSFVTKKDFATNLTNLNATLETAMVEVAAGQSEIEAQLANIPFMVDEAVAREFSGLRNMFLEAEESIAENTKVIEESTARIDGFDTWVDERLAMAEVEGLAEIDRMFDDYSITGLAELTADIEELTAWFVQKDSELTATNESLDELEAKLDGMTSGYVDDDGDYVGSPSPISIRISNSGGMLVASDNNTLSAPIKITLTKVAGLAVEDIVIIVELQTEGIPNFESVKLEGGGTAWRASGWQSSSGRFYTAEFMNTGWGLDMSASDTKKNIYTTLVITGSGYLEKDYNFQMDATVDDWE